MVYAYTAGGVERAATATAGGEGGRRGPSESETDGAALRLGATRKPDSTAGSKGRPGKPTRKTEWKTDSEAGLG